MSEDKFLSEKYFFFDMIIMTSLWNYLFQIQLGESDQVTVSDKNVSLPHIIKNVVIEKVSSYIVIYGYNGITVLWDGKYAVYVHVSTNHRNRTCGLCGNYNGLPDDDFMTYDRQQVSSVAKFGNSWRMTDVNQLCPNVREEETKSPCSSVTKGNMTQVTFWKKPQNI